MIGSVFRAFVTLLAVSVAGCLTPPPYAIATSYGVVRAPTLERAMVVSEHYVTDRAALEARLTDSQSWPVDVWVQQELRPTWWMRGPDNARGLTVHRRGRPPRVHVLDDGFEHTLAHELVHALLGSSWSSLPQALEEGLCDVLAQELHDTPQLERERVRAALGIEAQVYTLAWQVFLDGERLGWGSTVQASGGAGDEFVLRVALDPALTSEGAAFDSAAIHLEQALQYAGKSAFTALDSGEVRHVYGIGYALALRILDRVGLDGLHALCVRAHTAGLETIPASWVLETAAIESTEQFAHLAHTAWLRACYRDVLASEFLIEFLAKRVEQLEPDPREHGEELTYAVLCQTFDLLLRVNQEPPIALGDLPGFATWLETAWPKIAARP